MVACLNSVGIEQYLWPWHIAGARQEEQAPYKRGWRTKSFTWLGVLPGPGWTRVAHRLIAKSAAAHWDRYVYFNTALLLLTSFALDPHLCFPFTFGGLVYPPIPHRKDVIPTRGPPASAYYGIQRLPPDCPPQHPRRMVPPGYPPRRIGSRQIVACGVVNPQIPR